MLKPQDVVLALKLLAKDEEPWSQGGLAQEMSISASEVNSGIKRLALTHLIEPEAHNKRWQVVRPAIREFLVSGIQYVFPAEKGAPCIGMATANAAHPLRGCVPESNITPVWPDKKATQSGFSFKPLYPSVPAACNNDGELYQWLVLVDALRDWDNPHRDIAQVLLTEKLSGRRQSESAQEKLRGSNKANHQMDLLG
ncbi:Uncharacterised protein [BD1-7 clade bacterium]|uniref:Uncharacterized protein n=1 Tax=BD1-7 clade bacterium TaxID=2029982 RepID=A0A5S9QLY1_9GAMM|nr:Uncharacterised protein [BD1-7 clade bacterium]CAA0120783.1 Uncharacterised protein [BD1-7 clade bacterium]